MIGVDPHESGRTTAALDARSLLDRVGTDATAAEYRRLHALLRELVAGDVRIDLTTDHPATTLARSGPVSVAGQAPLEAFRGDRTRHLLSR